MTWVHYADRKPTQNDSLRGFVLVALKDESIHQELWNFSDSDALAWMNPKDLLPLPKRKIRRPPTQEDVDAATEPIPCRVRRDSSNSWRDRLLIGVSKFGTERFTAINDETGAINTWEEAEIEVEE